MNVPDGWAVHSCACGATEIIAGPGVTVEMRCRSCPPVDAIVAAAHAICNELAKVAARHAEEQRL